MISGDTTLLQVPIAFNSCYCDVAFNDIPLPEKCQLLGLVRQGQVILASENPTLRCGDTILAVALHSKMAPALQVVLKKTHSLSWTALRTT